MKDIADLSGDEQEELLGSAFFSVVSFIEQHMTEAEVKTEGVTILRGFAVSLPALVDGSNTVLTFIQ